MTPRPSDGILFGCVAENNHKYLSQALRLVQSVRWFGGECKDADIIVCVIGDIESNYHSALQSFGAEVRIVSSFDPANPLFNKIQIFKVPELEEYDTLLYLDCDTVVVQDPARYLSSSVLRIKMADVPTVPTEALERVCGYFGLRAPERCYRTTQDQVPTIWYCNAGIISCPVRFIPSIIPDWCEYELAFSANPDLLGPYQHHRSQAALALAFIANRVPFEELPVAMNFPLHLTHIQAPLEMLETDPVILHYHDLVDSEGYLLPSPYPLAQKRIESFNNRLRGLELSCSSAAFSELEPVSTGASAAAGKKEVSIIRRLTSSKSVGREVSQKLDGDRSSTRVRTEPIVVCVAGMHRSGTSMVARMIHSCGVYFGPERSLAASSPDNERGFWENVDFVNLNEGLLQELGGAWDAPPALPETWTRDVLSHLRSRAQTLISRFDVLKQWGWKDPRNSLTLPFWRQVVPRLKVVICLRNPLEVILSLVKRGSSADDSLFELWLTYNRALMATVPPENRVITHYSAYFGDPWKELRRVLEFLDVAASDEAIDRACSTISGELRHHNMATEDLTDAGISDEVVKEYLSMCREAGPVFQQTWSQVSQGGNVRRRDYRDILRSIRLENELELLRRTRESQVAVLESQVVALEGRLAEEQTRVAEQQALLAEQKARVAEEQARLAEQ